MDNVLLGPWAKRESADVILFGEKRPSFSDLAKLAGNFGDSLDVALGKSPRRKPTCDDLICLTEMLDHVALAARNAGYAHSMPSLLVAAQDAESLSERILHLAAEIGDGK